MTAKDASEHRPPLRLVVASSSGYVTSVHTEVVYVGKLFGGFLRSRREELTVADVDLPTTQRRRTPGLRRAEVASLASISGEYYTRLEQGRSGPPSPPVLASLADALRLDADGYAQLLALAFPMPALPPMPDRAVSAGVQALLDALDTTAPALVVGPSLNVLAWNRLASRTLTDFSACPVSDRNIMRHWAGDADAQTRYPDGIKRDLHLLRCMLDRCPNDPRLGALIFELNASSAEFAAGWAGIEYSGTVSGARVLDHPVVGRLDLHLEALSLPESPGQTVLTYFAAPGSDSQRRLAALAA